MNETLTFERNFVRTFRFLAILFYKFSSVFHGIKGLALGVPQPLLNRDDLVVVACRTIERQLEGLKRKLERARRKYRVLRRNAAEFCDEMGIISFHEQLNWVLYSSLVISIYLIFVLFKFVLRTMSYSRMRF